jgi:hypothetical protein
MDAANKTVRIDGIVGPQDGKGGFSGCVTEVNAGIEAGPGKASGDRRGLFIDDGIGREGGARGQNHSGCDQDRFFHRCFLKIGIAA